MIRRTHIPARASKSRKSGRSRERTGSALEHKNLRLPGLSAKSKVPRAFSIRVKSFGQRKKTVQRRFLATCTPYTRRAHSFSRDGVVLWLQWASSMKNMFISDSRMAVRNTGTMTAIYLTAPINSCQSRNAKVICKIVAISGRREKHTFARRNVARIKCLPPEEVKLNDAPFENELSGRGRRESLHNNITPMRKKLCGGVAFVINCINALK